MVGDYFECRGSMDIPCDHEKMFNDGRASGCEYCDDIGECTSDAARKEAAETAKRLAEEYLEKAGVK